MSISKIIKTTIDTREHLANSAEVVARRHLWSRTPAHICQASGCDPGVVAKYEHMVVPETGWLFFSTQPTYRWLKNIPVSPKTSAGILYSEEEWARVWKKGPIKCLDGDILRI